MIFWGFKASNTVRCFLVNIRLRRGLAISKSVDLEDEHSSPCCLFEGSGTTFKTQKEGRLCEASMPQELIWFWFMSEVWKVCMILHWFHSVISGWMVKPVQLNGETIEIPSDMWSALRMSSSVVRIHVQSKYLTVIINAAALSESVYPSILGCNLF